nr:myelin transcription factor 1-like protein [Drosophila takahashii]
MMKVYKQEEDKKVKRLYHQRYRSEWEKFPAFSSWLGSSNDGYSAHCRICDTNVLARLASIKQHLVTRKHQNMVKGELCKDEHDPDLEASIILTKPKPKPLNKPKPKPKSKQKMVNKMQTKIKNEPKAEQMEDDDDEEAEDDDEIHSNDSILDDLLRTDQPYHEEQEQEYVVDGEIVEEDQHVVDEHHEQEVVYEEEELMNIKPDEPQSAEFQDDAMSEDDAILSEFDLFGKSLALQLNNMDLEDALLCQERLQVVLTEFRLKILKRKRELKRSA